MSAVVADRSNPYEADATAAKRVMWLYVLTGLFVVGLMIIVGIAMRMEQARWIAYDPATFYALLSLHGVGMITAVALAGLGTLWYLVARETALDIRIPYVVYAFFVAGVACVIAAAVGRFGALWTVLYPLPFVGATWPSWSIGAYLIGNLLVMIGFTLWCLQVLAALYERYGGLAGILGIDYVLRGSAFEAAGRRPPPPQMFAAAVTGIDGIIASAAGMSIVIAMIVRWADASVQLDPLWAKNLTYLFGHSLANLTMYMAVAGIYVGLPLCTKREYHTSRPLVVAWWGTLTFVIIAYFHHLYMDFVQPSAVQFIGEIASYLAAIPVVVVTVYGGVLLVHRSGMRWSMGAMFLYAGMMGWVVGGTGALLDATIPINVDLHNTLWVPAHFHTYLLEGVLLFTLGWTFVNLEQRSGTTSSRLIRWLTGICMFGGGAVFLIGFYLAGSSGVPRRVATEPAPGPEIAGLATLGAIVFFIGLVLCLAEGIRLARRPASKSR